jgi:hypothetical protein
MEPETVNTDRREFLRKLARGGLLALLSAGTAALVARRRDPCDRRGVCRGCPVVTDCELPPAAAFREFLKREDPS